jgi:hypothetical protein
MRFAGMAATALVVAAVAGCSVLEQQVSVSPTPTPTPSVGSGARPSWVEDLTFSGDVSGTMNQVVAGSGGLRTICTGQRGQGGDTWVLTLFGPIGSATYGLQLTLSDYRGPGPYEAPQASMQVFRPDDTLGWRSLDGDHVSVVLDSGRQSGTVQATLTNLTNDSSNVHVSGRWSCL